MMGVLILGGCAICDGKDYYIEKIYMNTHGSTKINLLSNYKYVH